MMVRGADAFWCPDFNEPDFTSLDDRMLHQLDGSWRTPAARPPSPLIGPAWADAGDSGRGRIRDRVDRLVLLAPAVMFAKPGHHLLPPERIEEWRRTGSLRFFHYAYGEERPLDVAFYEDSLRHDSFEATFSQPAMVFQGMRDASVDYRTVEQFAHARPNVTLSLVDDDHQLTASLSRIWDGMVHFLELE
jgi:hypothetical protein